MAHPVPNETKLTSLQLEFLKSLKYMATEKQLNEVKSLLRHYFAWQNNNAIEKNEKEKNYTASIYESWLKNNSVNLWSTQ